MTVPSLRELVRLQAPDVVALLEIKNKAFHFGWLQKQLGMNFKHMEAQHVVLVKYANFLIEVGIHDMLHNHSWWFYTVYASTDAGVRKKQFKVLQNQINTCMEGCLVMGGF